LSLNRFKPVTAIIITKIMLSAVQKFPSGKAKEVVFETAMRLFKKIEEIMHNDIPER
jgi:L-ribulose-5-phosphate 3-epimerase UlaE